MGTTETKQPGAGAFARWEKGEGSLFEVVAWFDAGPLDELVNRVQPAQ